jgi:hypothetical protein
MLTNDRIKTVRIQEGCSAIHRSDLFPPNKSYSHVSENYKLLNAGEIRVG